MSNLIPLANEARTRIREISTQEAQILIDTGVLVVDVREENEFQAGHIPGARSIPRSTLRTRITTIAPDRATPILCYCTAGHRSALAAVTLRELGYLDVSSLAGGLNAYQHGYSSRKVA